MSRARPSASGALPARHAVAGGRLATARRMTAGAAFALVSALLAAALGLVVARPPLAGLAAVVVGGGVLVASVLRWPQLGPTLFWVVYAVQGTLLGGRGVTGLYYPLYGLMAVNAVVALALGRVVVGRRLVPYVLFLLVVLASLLPLRSPLAFAEQQRLFIYVIGFLAFLQFPTDREPSLLRRAQVLVTLGIAVWVVATSIATGFAYRGGVEVDQNDVSFLIGFGLLALLSRCMARPPKLLAAVPLWASVALGVYALLLLGSRGMSIAVGVAALVMFGRVVFQTRRSALVLLGALTAAGVLTTLPGSDNLFERFQGADVATANERLPLWRASLQELESGDAYTLLLGHGFGSSMTFIRRISATLTSTHNAYIQMLYDFGAFGLVAFLWLHLALLARFWRERGRLALFAAGLTAFLLMADASVTAPDRFFYWLALGQLLAIAFYLDRSRGRGEATLAPQPAGQGPERPPGTQASRAAPVAEAAPEAGASEERT